MARPAVRARRVRRSALVTALAASAIWPRGARSQDERPAQPPAPAAEPAPAPAPAPTPEPEPVFTPEPAPAPAATPRAEPLATPPKRPDPQILIVSAGLGLSYSMQAPGSGAGFYAALEYVIKPTVWLYPEAYAGTLITSPDSSSCDGPGSPCDVSARIGLVGGKLRLIAPIPYVAPFVEGGIGLSFGALTTRTPEADNGTTSFTYNVPVAVGLALGEDHSFEIGLSYLLHPAVGQEDGAFALSLVIPIN